MKTKKCFTKNSAGKPIMKAMLFAFATISPFAVVNVSANETLAPITGSDTKTENTGTITVNQDASGVAITGDANTLSAMNVSILGDILGDSNVLTATKTVKVDGDIRGYGNDIIITESTRMASALVVEVTGDIVGDLSDITINGNGSVKIAGTFAGNGTLGNTILLGGDGALSIGTLGYSTGVTTSSTRSLLGIQGEGDMNFNSISNNDNLEINIADGDLIVSNSSNGIVKNSTINVSDNISFGGVAADNLTLEGTQLISEKGNITATQNLAVSGVNGKIEVQNPNGEISVLGTLSAKDSASVTAKNVSANNISVDSGATISATNSITATGELSANRGILSALTISADSVSATNSSKITADTLTTDSISVDNSASITIKDALELDSLSVKNSAIITITGDNKLITAAEIALSGSSLLGISINGVGEGTISNFNITGTLTGTGALGSNIEISGDSEFGSSNVDGTISGFDNISFKDGEIAVYGDVTTIDNGIINVSNSADLHIYGKISANDININNSIVTVGTLLEDSDSIPNVMEAQHNIAIYYGSNVTVNGNQTAGKNIGIEAQATVIVNGNQAAKDGYIAIAGAGTVTTVYGNMTATATSSVVSSFEQMDAGDIYINDSTVTVGTLLEDSDSILNVMEAQNDIAISAALNVTVNGNQIAGKNIGIEAQATVIVNGNQTAKDGFIAIAGAGNITVSGNMTATATGDSSEAFFMGQIPVVEGDIYINGSTVTVGTLLEDSDSIPNVMEAQNNIGIYNGSNVTVNGNQTAGKNIGIEAQATVIVNGNQTAKDGFIVIAGAGNVTVYGNMTATANGDSSETIRMGQIPIVEGDIYINNSIVTVGTLLEDSDSIPNVMEAQHNIAIYYGSNVTVNGNQIAGKNIGIEAPSTVIVNGNQIAKDGFIVIAGAGNVTVYGNMTATANGDSSETIRMGQIPIVEGDIYINDSTVTVGTLLESFDSIPNVMEAQHNIGIYNGSNVTVNGNQTAGKNIGIEAQATVIVNGNQAAKDGFIVIAGAENVTVSGNMTATATGDSSETFFMGQIPVVEGDIYINGSTVVVGKQLVASELIIDNNSDVTINNMNNAVGLEDGQIASVINSDIETIRIDNSKLTVGTVSLDDVSFFVNISDGNFDDFVEIIGHSWISKGEHRICNASIEIENELLLTGNNTLLNTTLHSLNGSVSIIGNQPGDDGEFSSTVLESRIIADGYKEIEVAGKTISVGVILDNVSLNNTEVISSAAEMDGDLQKALGTILIRNNVKMINGSFQTHLEFSELLGQQSLLLDKDAVLKIGYSPMLRGVAYLSFRPFDDVNLSSVDKTARVVVEGRGELQITRNIDEYKGTIELLDGTSSLRILNDVEIGEDVEFKLKNVILTFGNREYYYDAISLDTDASPWEIKAGTINTLADGEVSLIVDDSIRPMGRMVNPVYSERGSIIVFDSTSSNNKIKLNSLKLSEFTRVQLDAEPLLDGGIQVDTIELSGILDANGASIVLNGNLSEDDLKDIKSVQLVKFGENAELVSNFNSDLVHNIEGLDTLNVHIKTTSNGVELVVSENIRSTLLHKTSNQRGVAGLVALGDHAEITADSTVLDQIADAFNHTQSGADALAGLDSLSGSTTTIMQHSMIDATRSHIETIFSKMGMPTKNAANAEYSFWVAYTGDYDSLNGDSNMDAYSHTNHGFTVGGTWNIDNNYAVGMAVGYNDGVARSTSTKATINNEVFDLYGTAILGGFNHRASIGFGFSDFDMSRGVNIAAGSHTFSQVANGETDGLTFSLAYELSKDIAISDRTKVVPFASIMYAHHSIDNMEEEGLGDASLKFSYDDMSQFNVGVGAMIDHKVKKDDKLSPSVFASAAIRAELNDRQPTANVSSLTYNYGYKVESLNRDALYIQLGAGLSVPIDEKWTVSLSASCDLGNDRANASGNLSVGCTF